LTIHAKRRVTVQHKTCGAGALFCEQLEAAGKTLSASQIAIGIAIGSRILFSAFDADSDSECACIL
jgi:hypothetical protein